jgi:penicillin amidase
VRTGYDSRLPGSWQAPGTGWTGWREPQEYPRLVDPPSGRLWTANNRTLELERWTSLLGGDSYDLGARAAQIRDDLSSLHGASAADLLKIQLDDRALFLVRWRDLLLETLVPPSLEGHAARVRARSLVESWSARASVDDPGYPIVKAFHDEVRRAIFESLIAPARSNYPKGVFFPPNQFEGAVWQLVTERPPHMLDARYASWHEFLLASLDAALSGLEKQCGSNEPCSWGRLNALQMRHPLSRALPFASSWLDMPPQPLPGDSNMPRVQNPSFGASERLVVSPGHEDSGYLEVPGSQVDHPLSPFYRAGHEAWVRGEPTPLLPGETRYALRLIPPD